MRPQSAERGCGRAMFPERYGETHLAGRRISPKVRTLRQSRLSSVASIHLVTVGSGLGFMSSEMTLVSSRNPLTGQPSDRSLASVPDRLAPLPEAIRQRTWRGFEAALHVP